MKSKLTMLKHSLSAILLFTLLLSSCKKDQLKIDQEKEFIQVDFKFDPSFPYNGGWGLTLKPDGVADLIPGGDIVYRGTYKISGKNLTVKIDSQTFKFEIISETEIKVKENDLRLKLR